jgi:hypothetical protein
MSFAVADPEDPTTERKPATLLQLLGAVFWSFFGVRKGSAFERDAVSIKPLHVIIVGVVLAALLVLCLVLLVRLITH